MASLAAMGYLVGTTVASKRLLGAVEREDGGRQAVGHSE